MSTTAESSSTPSSTPSSTSTSARAALLAGLASVLIGGSLVLAFRIPLDEFEVALRAQAARLASLGVAGFALACAGAFGPGAGPLREASIYAVSIGAGVGAALGLGFVDAGSLGFATLLLAGAGGVLGHFAVRGATRCGRATVFVLGGLGVVLLGAGIVAAGIGSTEIPGAGGIVLWLLGAPTVGAPLGLLAAGALVLGLVALALRGAAAREPATALSGGLVTAAAPAALLFGLGVGLAGPVAFVGFFAPWLVVRVLGAGGALRTAVWLSGLVGAAALMLADAVPRALVGGYALPLNVSIAVPALPALLLVARSRSVPERAAWIRWIEVLAILGAGAVMVYVATAFTLFVRQAT